MLILASEHAGPRKHSYGLDILDRLSKNQEEEEVEENEQH